ncbi:MAG: putative porin, partial [Psychromonas sp.]
MTMNKAILPAIISALLATSAQAATLYQVADTTVKMSGELDAYYKVFDSEGTSVGTTDENGILSTWANVQLDL